jgi:hypothetical protein
MQQLGYTPRKAIGKNGEIPEEKKDGISGGEAAAMLSSRSRSQNLPMPYKQGVERT